MPLKPRILAIPSVALVKCKAVLLSWETRFLPLLVLTRWGAAPAIITNTGNNFPREYQRILRNCYQNWCNIFVELLPFSTALDGFSKTSGCAEGILSFNGKGS